MTVVGGDVTSLLRRWRAGNAAAGQSLLPLIYEELRRIATRSMRCEPADHTWRPSDLVSEAYIRLIEGGQPEWNDRAHFFAVAAGTMRKILIDHARRRRASKRGSGVRSVPLDEQVPGTSRPIDLIALDGALDALAKHDSRKARALELSYFGGLNQHEVASELELHVNTVARDLNFARAWVRRYIQDNS